MRGSTWGALGAAIVCAIACHEPVREQPAADGDAGLSAGARPARDALLREAQGAPRHPADGGGRAWIAAIEDAAGDAIAPRAGGRARFRLVFEVGPEGIAPEGKVTFQPSRFFGWAPPQPVDPDRTGFTQIEGPEGVRLRLRYQHPQRVEILPFERGLAAGERLRIAYGAGRELAAVDSLAEREARFWIGVDGDGDGVAAWIAELPTVDVVAGPPALLTLAIPSRAPPGEAQVGRVSVLDAVGNTRTAFAGEVRLEADPGLELPAAVGIGEAAEGRASFGFRAVRPGVYRIRAIAASPALAAEIQTTSNPLRVAAESERVYWGDLHGHSQLSDGTGTPEDYFAYARDVAGLDFAALTDHDHWGMRNLDEEPALWQRIRAAVARAQVPGAFVALLGYEWTSWLHGHRHVVYFGDEGAVHSSIDPGSETPQQLWDALRGQRALTFAHHSAGGPIATNWRYRPDPELEPVTEIVSYHGSSEAPDSPHPIYDPVAGNFVRDLLADGVRIGFIGSGDSHNGHPGLTQIASPRGGGLVALFAEELTRESVRSALRARRVYATNGPRILLEVSLDGAPMGSVVAPGASDATLRVRVIAEAPLARVDLVRSGDVTSIGLDGELEWSDERRIAPLGSGESLYVRAVQRDRGAAWSSPIFGE